MKPPLDSFMGLPVAFDERVDQVAVARGVLRQRIVVGKVFMFLNDRQRHAVLLHEAGHCFGRHLLQRILLIPIFWTRFAQRVTHAQEFAADAFCARAGYASELMQVIWYLSNRGGGDFHPCADERCARLAQLLREQSDVQMAA